MGTGTTATTTTTRRGGGRVDRRSPPARLAPAGTYDVRGGGAVRGDARLSARATTTFHATSSIADQFISSTCRVASPGGRRHRQRDRVSDAAAAASQPRGHGADREDRPVRVQRERGVHRPARDVERRELDRDAGGGESRHADRARPRGDERGDVRRVRSKRARAGAFARWQRRHACE